MAICGGGADAVTLMVPVRVTPAYIAEIVTLVMALTADLEIVKNPIVEPAATVTLAGTETTAGLLLVTTPRHHPAVPRPTA